MAASDQGGKPSPAERVTQAMERLGILRDRPDQRGRLVNKVELFLWHFLRLRWYDAHRFFESVESKEALEFVKEGYAPGGVFEFFSARQDDTEFENTLTVGVHLVMAATKKAAERGFAPATAGIFTLQRMLEQILEDVGSLQDLLDR